MKKSIQALLGAVGTAAMAIPLASLAGPTVYIPLGSANEILIVDAKTDKVTGSIRGVTNPHGLSLTTNGKYLVAGSNTEKMAGQGKKAGMGHGGKPKKSGMSPMPKPKGMSDAEHKSHHPQQGGSSSGMMGGQSSSGMMGGQSRTPVKPKKPTPMPKPKGMSDAEHKSHHAPQGGGTSGMKGGQSKAPAKPGKSATMARPKGMSEADHKKHHAPQAGGLPPAVGISKISLIRVADNQVEQRIKSRSGAWPIIFLPHQMENMPSPPTPPRAQSA